MTAVAARVAEQARQARKICDVAALRETIRRQAVTVSKAARKATKAA